MDNKLMFLLMRGEVLLLLIGVVVLAGVPTQGLLTTFNLAAAFTSATPVALIALEMTLVIIAGHIDLSIGPMSLSSCVSAGPSRAASPCGSRSSRCSVSRRWLAPSTG